MRNIIWGVSAILLVAYLVFIFIWINMTADEPKCIGMDITLNESASNSFVTIEEISRELDFLPEHCVGMPIREINTDSLERLLNGIDKIEDAECVILNTGRIKVVVTPMLPVARIFDGEESYYINRVGKRISADARYYLDVPVLAGNFNDTNKAVDMLPMLDYIYNDSLWSSLISMVKINNNNEIILVPKIKGHVIDFGNKDNMENKFTRLAIFYKEVMQYKGWDCYEKISVKWDGQIVATKRKKTTNDKGIKYDSEIENEMPDIEAMIADQSNDSIAETTKKNN